METVMEVEEDEVETEVPDGEMTCQGEEEGVC